MSTHNFDNLSSTVRVPYGLLIQRGNFPTVNGWEASGYNPDVGTNFETVYDGSNIYTYPAGAVAMTVTSAAGATDNGVEVIIIGLDANYDVLIESVTLAGLGTATTNGEFLRINRAYVNNGQESTANITIANGGTTYAIITLPYMTTQMAIYTVPRNKKAYLVYASVSLEKSKEVIAKFMSRKPGGIFVTGGIVGTTGSYSREWVIPPVFGEKTDVEIRAKAGATTSISTSMQFILEDD